MHGTCYWRVGHGLTWLTAIPASTTRAMGWESNAARDRGAARAGEWARGAARCSLLGLGGSHAELGRERPKRGGAGRAKGEEGGSRELGRGRELGLLRRLGRAGLFLFSLSLFCSFYLDIVAYLYTYECSCSF
jgi:hypothetical protein